MSTSTHGASPLLRLDGATVRYAPGMAPAVLDVHLEVAAGERVALIGSSGAGKTTILSLANATVLPTDGAVQILGTDSRELGGKSGRAVRRLIGTVPQDHAIVGPLRVAQNVAAGRLGRWNAFESLRALVRPADVDGILDVLEQVGIPEKLWERADRLSGGQQQRVAIARTLYQGARLLLADEPVSALDRSRSAAVLEVLTDAVRADPTRALVASLHDAPLALRFCSRIVAVRDGSVLFDRASSEVGSDELDAVYELDH